MSFMNGNLPGGYPSSKERGKIIEPAFSHEELSGYIKKAGLIIGSLIVVTLLALVWVM